MPAGVRVQDPSPNGYTREERKEEEILRAYQERSSLRGLRRTFGVSPTTVISWLKKVAVLGLQETLVATQEGEKVLELDELWSFVYRKGDKVGLARPVSGDRQVVAFVMGDRSGATASVYGERYPKAIRRQPATATSGRRLPGGAPRRAARGCYWQGGRRDFPRREVDQHLTSEAFALC